MSTAIAFDIYGTLIDPHGVVEDLARHLGEGAQGFSNVWRDKQLEYSFRRGLMGRYENFPVCTRQALDYADSLLKTGLSDAVKDELDRMIEAVFSCAHRLFGLNATPVDLKLHHEDARAWEITRNGDHVALFIDGKSLKDRKTFSDSLGPDSELYVMQALSGG